MTIQEIQKRVDEIRDNARNDEAAHGCEDSLYADFIRYVSTLKNPTLAEKAKLVLTTENIEFSRWCA